MKEFHTWLEVLQSAFKNRSYKWIIECANCEVKTTREEALKGEVVAAAGRLWHTRHFRCTECQATLSNNEFYTSGTNVICLDCYLDDVNMKCAECNRTLYEKYLSVNGQYLHHDCFVCARCKNPMPAGQYLIHEGKCYDEECYYHVKYRLNPQK